MLPNVMEALAGKRLEVFRMVFRMDMPNHEADQIKLESQPEFRIIRKLE